MIGTRLFVVMLTVNMLFMVGGMMGAHSYSFSSSMTQWVSDTLNWDVDTGGNTTINTTNSMVSGAVGDVGVDEGLTYNPLRVVFRGLGAVLDMFFAPLTIFMMTGMPWQIQLLVGVPWSALWYISVFSFFRGFAF